VNIFCSQKHFIKSSKFNLFLYLTLEDQLESNKTTYKYFLYTGVELSEFFKNKESSVSVELFPASSLDETGQVLQ